MLTDPGPFDDAHERQELDGIAEWERKLKDGERT